MTHIGTFETPDRRLARLRSALDTTAQSMGDTVNKAVDLESRRRAMEDNLRRFREVEREQLAERRNRATQLAALGLGTIPGVDFSPEARARREASEAGRPPPDFPGGGLPASVAESVGLVLKGAEAAQTRFFDPIAASALQVAEAPTGIPVIAELKGVQAGTETIGRTLGGADIGVPVVGEVVEAAGFAAGAVGATLPRERSFEEVGEFVDPFAAALGSKEEIAKAQAVLEEAGLPRALAAQILFDPFNVFPGIGFSKVDDFARLLRLATKAAPKARAAAIKALRESDTFQQALRGIRGETGGRRGVGVPEQVPEATQILGEAATRRPPQFLGDPQVTPAGPRVGETFRAEPMVPEGTLQGAERFEAARALEAGLAEAAPKIAAGTDIRAAIRTLEQQLTGAGKGARGVGRQAAIRRRIEGLKRLVDEADIHIAKADPGPPPPRKPVAGGATPDDPEFENILNVALKGEKPPETLIRRHQGAIDTAKRIAANEVRDNNKTLVKIGLGRNFRGSVVARTEGSFDELNSLLHNPGAVARGERIVPDELRPIYDKLRQQTDWEQAARIDFDPDQALVEDYFFRGWQPPEGMFTGEVRGPLGRNPVFRLPRVNATYDEMFEAGFRPLFDNPAEQARYSQVMGIKYREQMKLIEKIKSSELALPVVGGPVPKDWRVPRVGPAFEGKPYADGTRVAFTRRWAVPDSLANRLENVYGVTPKLGKGEIFGKAVDFNKAIDAVTFTPKRFKLVGSLFQHIDFLSRSHIGAWTGFADAIRRGQPATAVVRLAKWPQSAVDIVHATFNPNFRARLAKLAVDDTPVWEGRKISNRMISEAGLSLRDETIFPQLDDVIRQVRQEPRIVRLGKAPFRALGDLERQWRQGLFDGVYPAAILSDIKNNIGPMIIKQHPEATDAQLAGMIAKAANEVYSTIPASMSVIQNKQARWFLTRFLFSLGENEGLLRSFTGAIRGENAAFFRTRLVGTYLGLMALAATIHIATTGKPLPLDRFTPISKDKWGPLPVGYNTDFASPDIPLKGRGGANVMLDLVMQQDTIFRILDPKSFLSSRTSVPVRAIENQRTGKDFFGAPIDTVGPGGVFSRTTQLVQDLFAPIGPGQAGLQILRNNIEETEGLIQPAEARLGTTGVGIQSAGINLRAERTPELLDRIRAEILRDRGIEQSYEEIAANDLPLKAEIDDEVEERIGGELEIRGETSKLRGQQTPQSEGFEALEATRERQQAEQLEDDANLNSGQWAGDIWREKYADRQRDIFSRNEQIKEDFQITFDDKAAPSKSVNAAIDTYFDVNVDEFNLPDGTTDWDGFFDARDAALRPLSVMDKNRVKKWLRKFDTPTVTEFREAQEIIDRVFETPKYKDLTLEQGEEADRILNEDVPNLQTQALREGIELERTDAVHFIIERGVSSEVEAWLKRRFKKPRSQVVKDILRDRLRAVGVPTDIIRRIVDRPGPKLETLVNPERDNILLENQEILAKFYPDILARQLNREQEAGLGESAFAAVQR